MCPWSLALAEHSCPWPREGLSSEGLSLALASDFFCVLGLGLEPCVLDSTSEINAIFEIFFKCHYRSRRRVASGFSFLPPPRFISCRKKPSNFGEDLFFLEITRFSLKIRLNPIQVQWKIGTSSTLVFSFAPLILISSPPRSREAGDAPGSPLRSSYLAQILSFLSFWVFILNAKSQRWHQKRRRKKNANLRFCCKYFGGSAFNVCGYLKPELWTCKFNRLLWSSEFTIVHYDLTMTSSFDLRIVHFEYVL